MLPTNNLQNMMLPINSSIDWKVIPHQVVNYPAKTILLEEGKVANKLFVIQKGAARLWFNSVGNDITLQFFFEGSPVCSIESFIQSSPSEFYIETLEPSTVLVIDKSELLSYGESHPDKKEIVVSYLVNRLFEYTHLFLYRIKDTPQQRYLNLLNEHPNIIQRVAQRYIASYLGITTVSLSRIKARI